MSQTGVYIGEELAKYSFGDQHPFGPKRHDAFVAEFKRQHLHERTRIISPVKTEQAVIELFHDAEYVQQVIEKSQLPAGYLDGGDTPAFADMFNTTSYVVGSTLDAIDKVITGELKRAFIPIAGLHHARRNRAAGFCVFNDCGVAIEILRRKYNIQRVAYVDIDAHHGDGVFYSFDNDPDLIFVDIHEDGRFLYPGTGAIEETGRDTAAGTKLNIPMPMDAGDQDFLRVWESAEKFLQANEPEFILLQCGADSLDGDPITHMRYSEKSHAYAAHRLCLLANEFCQGRIVAMGGGGYNLDNLARAWCAVVNAFVSTE